MKLSKNVARINLETGSTFDTLQKDRVIHFSSKIMYKNQWYYRTTHNTGTNSPFGIPASSVGEAN
jgi:hypothetical protein